MFKHRCPRRIGNIWYSNFVSNSIVRREVVGPVVQPLKQVLNSKLP